jgi:hypothetical protein
MLVRLLHAPREMLGVRDEVVIEEKLVCLADADRLLGRGGERRGQ